MTPETRTHAGPPDTHHKRVVPVALLYILILSSTFVAIKIGLRFWPPLMLLSVRFLIAGAVTGMIAHHLGAAWPKTQRAWFRLCSLGVVNTMMPATCNFFALDQVSVGMAAIVLASNPLMLTLLAPKLLGEQLTTTRIMGLVFGFGGVVFVMVVRVGAGGKTDTPLGLVLLLGAVASMVGGTILFKKFPPREELIMINTVQHLVAGGLLVPISLATENPMKAVMNLQVLAAMGYMVLCMSVGATLLWFWLLARGEASVASSFYFLSPILGIAFGAVLFKETFGWREAVGLTVISTGIVLIRRTGKTTPGALTSVTGGVGQSLRPPTLPPPASRL